MCLCQWRLRHSVGKTFRNRSIDTCGAQTFDVCRPVLNDLVSAVGADAFARPLPGVNDEGTSGSDVSQPMDLVRVVFCVECCRNAVRRQSRHADLSVLGFRGPMRHWQPGNRRHRRICVGNRSSSSAHAAEPSAGAYGMPVVWYVSSISPLLRYQWRCISQETVGGKLDNLGYDTTEGFAADVRQVFDNALGTYKPEDMVHHRARKLKDMFGVSHRSKSCACSQGRCEDHF